MRHWTHYWLAIIRKSGYTLPITTLVVKIFPPWHIVDLPLSVHGNFSLRTCPAGRRCPRRGRRGTAVERAASPAAHADLQTGKGKLGLRMCSGSCKCTHSKRYTFVNPCTAVKQKFSIQWRHVDMSALRSALHYNTFCSPCRVTVSDWTMRNKDKQQRRPVERWGPNIDLQNRR